MINKKTFITEFVATYIAREVASGKNNNAEMYDKALSLAEYHYKQFAYRHPGQIDRGLFAQLDEFLR